MPDLIYSMTVSIDGLIAGPQGEIDWSPPDEELFQFHTDKVRELGAHLVGRRLYETMLYWETADRRPAATETDPEFARIWRALPKVVFSTTLDHVEGNARLCTDRPAAALARVREQTDKDLAVGGARLASTFVKLDLIDEYRQFVSPVVLGGGTPYLPAPAPRLDLELVETRTFASRVVYLRYRRVRT